MCLTRARMKNINESRIGPRRERQAEILQPAYRKGTVLAQPSSPIYAGTGRSLSWILGDVTAKGINARKVVETGWLRREWGTQKDKNQEEQPRDSVRLMGKKSNKVEATREGGKATEPGVLNTD